VTFPLPTPDQVRESADALGLHVTDAYVEDYLRYIEPWAEHYEKLGRMVEPLPVADYPRTFGHRPQGEENPHNAWYWKCRVEGAADGPLKGRRVAVKDNVCVAGVPASNGASVLEGYIADTDATVVTRLLDAGAEIVGKAVAEYFSYSGGSTTASTGNVENPRDPGYSAGGSSSGSGALVAAGEVDMAVGGDQSGSVRIPACYCGVVGIKPTYGLIPYTGIMPIDATIDHAGLLTANVADSALFLDVVAGADGLDPRQYSPQVSAYTKALDQGVDRLRIGMVRESFGRADSEPEVDEAVLAAADRLRGLGALVEEVSIPWHLNAVTVWAPIGIQGSYSVGWLHGGVGSNHQGVYVTSLVKAMADMRERADEFPDTFKVVSLFAHHAQRYHGQRFYAKAQNVRRRLRDAYDEALSRFDLLLLPTTPMRTTPIPGPDVGFQDFMKHSLQMIGNTCAFDVTGHPALTVPCGPEDELAVGMMLVAPHWGESAIYSAASAFERSA
jgi:amidase